MNKLLSCRKYLSLQETQDYLAKALEESVSLQDIYGLILDGLLTLSIRLIAQEPALKGKFIKREETETKKLTTEFTDVPSSGLGDFLIEHSQDKQFVHDQCLHHIDGVWDTLMIGAMPSVISQLRNQHGDPVMLDNSPGLSGNIYLIRDEEVGVLLQRSLLSEAEKTAEIRHLLSPMAAYYGWTVDELRSFSEIDLFMRVGKDIQEERERIIDSVQNLSVYDLRNYKTATKFSGPHEYVIKTEEITRFIGDMECEKADQPLSTKQRNSYLYLISGLLKELKINASDRGVAVAIQLILENAGHKLSENTIRSILREVSDIEH
ncbi:hypothetical protein [Vibrio caribbeanicus]|uniref:Uncharacterized protein n=1 Tax=Vibrio caribbeanicus ATCC BAA-2122 TaxID=796620 RepID=E3BPZ4_9VIBR|nr:hypothetical protein [Vibrio caribbeanicus]EFP94919.1 hypothetical protein VIBC2010_02591 [Vibrio caribbeanicus ATCC BAA-2122]